MIKEIVILKGEKMPRYVYYCNNILSDIAYLRGWKKDVEKSVAAGLYTEQRFKDQFDRGVEEIAARDYFALVWGPPEPEQNEFGVVSP